MGVREAGAKNVFRGMLVSTTGSVEVFGGVFALGIR